MTFWDAYYALLAFVATIPVIASFTAGAWVVLICVVWVLLGEPDTAGTAEQETERKELAARRALEHDDAALGYANLPRESSLQGIDAELQEMRALLTSPRFLAERRAALSK